MDTTGITVIAAIMVMDAGNTTTTSSGRIVF